MKKEELITKLQEIEWEDFDYVTLNLTTKKSSEKTSVKNITFER